MQNDHKTNVNGFISQRFNDSLCLKEKSIDSNIKSFSLELQINEVKFMKYFFLGRIINFDIYEVLENDRHTANTHTHRHVRIFWINRKEIQGVKF